MNAIVENKVHDVLLNARHLDALESEAIHILREVAAAYLFGLVKNHPFIDGNKRTAHVCYRVFLQLNGSNLLASSEEKYAAMIGLAEGSLSEAEFAQWLREHIEIEKSGKVQEAKAKYR